MCLYAKTNTYDWCKFGGKMKPYRKLSKILHQCQNNGCDFRVTGIGQWKINLDITCKNNFLLAGIDWRKKGLTISFIVNIRYPFNVLLADFDD